MYDCPKKLTDVEVYENEHYTARLNVIYFSCQ